MKILILTAALVLVSITSFAQDFSPLEIKDSSNAPMSSINNITRDDYPSLAYYYTSDYMKESGLFNISDFYAYSPLFRFSTSALSPLGKPSALMLNGGNYGRDSRKYMDLIMEIAPVKSLRGIEISDYTNPTQPGGYGTINIIGQDGRTKRELYFDCSTSTTSRISPSLSASFPSAFSSYGYTAQYGYLPGKRIFINDKSPATEKSPEGKDAFLQFSSAGCYGRFLVKTDLLYAYDYSSSETNNERELLNFSINAHNSINSCLQQDFFAGILKGSLVVKDSSSSFDHQEENAIFLTSSFTNSFNIRDISIFSLTGTYLHQKNNYYFDGPLSETDFSLTGNSASASISNNTNIRGYFKSMLAYGYNVVEQSGRHPFFDGSIRLTHPASGISVFGKTSYSTEVPTVDELNNPLSGTGDENERNIFTLSGGIAWHKINTISANLGVNRYRYAYNDVAIKNGVTARELLCNVTITPIKPVIIEGGVNHAIRTEQYTDVLRRKTYLSLGLVSKAVSLFLRGSESYGDKEYFNAGFYLSFAFADYHLSFKGDNLLERQYESEGTGRTFTCSAGTAF